MVALKRAAGDPRDIACQYVMVPAGVSDWTSLRRSGFSEFAIHVLPEPGGARLSPGVSWRNQIDQLLDGCDRSTDPDRWQDLARIKGLLLLTSDPHADELNLDGMRWLTSSLALYAPDTNEPEKAWVEYILAMAALRRYLAQRALPDLRTAESFIDQAEASARRSHDGVAIDFALQARRLLALSVDSKQLDSDPITTEAKEIEGFGDPQSKEWKLRAVLRYHGLLLNIAFALRVGSYDAAEKATGQLERLLASPGFPADRPISAAAASLAATARSSMLVYRFDEQVLLASAAAQDRAVVYAQKAMPDAAAGHIFKKILTELSLHEIGHRNADAVQLARALQSAMGTRAVQHEPMIGCAIELLSKICRSGLPIGVNSSLPDPLAGVRELAESLEEAGHRHLSFRRAPHLAAMLSEVFYAVAATTSAVEHVASSLDACDRLAGAVSGDDISPAQAIIRGNIAKLALLNYRRCPASGQAAESIISSHRALMAAQTAGGLHATRDALSIWLDVLEEMLGAGDRASVSLLLGFYRTAVAVRGLNWQQQLRILERAIECCERANDIDPSERGEREYLSFLDRWLQISNGRSGAADTEMEFRFARARAKRAIADRDRIAAQDILDRLRGLASEEEVSSSRYDACVELAAAMFALSAKTADSPEMEMALSLGERVFESSEATLVAIWSDLRKAWPAPGSSAALGAQSGRQCNATDQRWFELLQRAVNDDRALLSEAAALALARCLASTPTAAKRTEITSSTFASKLLEASRDLEAVLSDRTFEDLLVAVYSNASRYGVRAFTLDASIVFRHLGILRKRISRDGGSRRGVGRDPASLLRAAYVISEDAGSKEYHAQLRRIIRCMRWARSNWTAESKLLYLVSSNSGLRRNRCSAKVRREVVSLVDACGDEVRDAESLEWFFRLSARALYWMTDSTQGGRRRAKLDSEAAIRRARLKVMSAHQVEIDPSEERLALGCALVERGLLTERKDIVVRGALEIGQSIYSAWGQEHLDSENVNARILLAEALLFIRGRDGSANYRAALTVLDEAMRKVDKISNPVSWGRIVQLQIRAIERCGQASVTSVRSKHNRLVKELLKFRGGVLCPISEKWFRARRMSWQGAVGH